MPCVLLYCVYMLIYSKILHTNYVIWKLAQHFRELNKNSSSILSNSTRFCFKMASNKLTNSRFPPSWVRNLLKINRKQEMCDLPRGGFTCESPVRLASFPLWTTDCQPWRFSCTRRQTAGISENIITARHWPTGTTTQDCTKRAATDERHWVGDYFDNRFTISVFFFFFYSSSFFHRRICCVSLSSLMVNEEPLGFGRLLGHSGLLNLVYELHNLSARVCAGRLPTSMKSAACLGVLSAHGPRSVRPQPEQSYNEPS